MQGQRAGGSAQERYDELRRAWIRRNRRVFTLLAVILLMTAAISNFIAFHYDRPWWGGMVTGAALCFWIAARLTPPGWIENWQAGAWGEEATAKQLARLPRADWVVHHDINTGRGNIDHLIVGPAGVFVLDSKRWAGSVTVVGDRAIVARPGAAGSYVWDRASALLQVARLTHDRMKAVSRVSQWVTPVVVVWAEFDQGIAGDRCAFVAGEGLAEWLQAQPHNISLDRVPQLDMIVRKAWGSDQSRL